MGHAEFWLRMPPFVKSTDKGVPAGRLRAAVTQKMVSHSPSSDRAEI